MTRKLVRDKVGEMPWHHEAAKEALRVAHDHELDSLLRQKLLEEVSEFLEAPTEADAIEEAGDVLEVMLAILARCGDGTGDSRTVVSKMTAKRQSRGGFATGLMLELR